MQGCVLQVVELEEWWTNAERTERWKRYARSWYRAAEIAEIAEMRSAQR